MSTNSEIKAFLKDSGFWIKREAKHGTVWTDGYAVINVSREYNNPMAETSVRQAVKRALRAREERDEKARMKANGLHQPVGVITKDPRSFKFTPEERTRVRDRVKHLWFAEQMKAPEIAKKLNEEGFLNPAGKPINEGFVWNQITFIRKEMDKQKSKEQKAWRRKQQEMTQRANETGSPIVEEVPVTERGITEPQIHVCGPDTSPAMQLMAEEPPKPVLDPPTPLAPAMTAGQAADALKEILQPTPPKRVIPDAVASIMNSTSLDDERKVKMLLWWAEEAQSELGELIINVLTEPLFSAKIKLRMLKELL